MNVTVTYDFAPPKVVREYVRHGIRTFVFSDGRAISVTWGPSVNFSLGKAN